MDISNHYNVEKPSITRTVQRLQDLRLVNHIAGKDKREKIIQLTELGEEIYLTCRQKITELEHSVLAGISYQEQKAIFDVLPQIRANLMHIDKEGENND